MAILSALGSTLPLVGGVVSGIFGSNSQKRANEANMELAKYQYEKNLEMWNRNNEYNTPEQQRKRMEAAGFNPNLVYGHGSVVNTSSSVPQYSAPTMQAYTNYPNLGDAALQGLLQTEQTIANVDKTKAETKAAEAVARKQVVEAQNAENYGSYNAKAENELLEYSAELKKLSLAYERIFSQYYKDIASNNKEISDYAMEKAQAEVIRLRTETDEILSRSYLNEAKTREADAHAGVLNTMPAYYESMTALNLITSSLKEIDHDFARQLKVYEGLKDSWAIRNSIIDFYESKQAMPHRIGKLKQEVRSFLIKNGFDESYLTASWWEKLVKDLLGAAGSFIPNKKVIKRVKSK